MNGLGPQTNGGTLVEAAMVSRGIVGFFNFRGRIAEGRR
jgi:hypothetical protein